MRKVGLLLAALTVFAPQATAQSCFQIHGRAISYRGDGFLAIWHLGTHHIFYPSDKASGDLVCRYFDCDSGDREPALFADFTICPTEPYTAGAAQGATVKAVKHARVVPDWPAPRSANGYVKEFYDWYVPRALKDSSSWLETLRLARWDLSPKLARLLEDDAEAQAHCAELIGIDFDPFLNTQDPAEHYEVGAATQEGNRYLLDIYAVDHGERASKPDVVAVVARDADRWYFVNYLYPGDKTDLLTILESPRLKCTVPRDAK